MLMEIRVMDEQDKWLVFLWYVNFKVVTLQTLTLDPSEKKKCFNKLYHIVAFVTSVFDPI